MSRHVHGQNRRILIPSHIRPRHQHLAWPQQYSCQEDTSQAQRPERPAAARHFGAQPRCLEGNEAMVHDLHVIVFKTTANNGNICNIKFCSNSGFFLFRREFGCGLPFLDPVRLVVWSGTIHLGTDSFRRFLWFFSPLCWDGDLRSIEYP